MFHNISLEKAVNFFMPLSRFSEGESGKIFEEVKKSGFKILLENNLPVYVLITFKAYEELLGTLERYRLLSETERQTEDFIPAW